MKQNLMNQKATSDFVFNFDVDDFQTPNRIIKQLDVFKRRSNVDVTTVKIYRCYNTIIDKLLLIIIMIYVTI